MTEAEEQGLTPLEVRLTTAAQAAWRAADFSCQFLG